MENAIARLKIPKRQARANSKNFKNLSYPSQVVYDLTD